MQPRATDVRPAPAGLALAALGLLALVAVLAGCQAPAPQASGRGDRERSPELLRPWLTVSGARAPSAIDKLGAPLPGAPARQIRLMRPISAASHGNDVYILDTGLDSLLRYDVTLDVIVPLGTVRAPLGARIRTLSDASVLALDPAGRRVLRIQRSGQIMQTFSDAANLLRPVDIAADEAQGLLFVADGALNRIIAFRFSSRASFPIVPARRDNEQVLSIAAIAAFEGVLYVLDPVGRQVGVLAYDGRLIRVFGHLDLVRPQALAIDRYRRVWVADAGDASMKVFENGVLTQKIGMQGLRVQSAQDLHIADSVLTVADADASRVQLLRAVPPRSGGKGL